MEEFYGKVPRTRRGWYDWIDTNWFLVLLGGATVFLTLATIYQFSQHPFYVNKDSALFQHAGWYIGQGAELYVDIWDLKPPLIYAVTTVLAVLSFGNMELLHLLSVAVAVATIVGGVTLVGVITHRLTNDGFASVVAGASTFVVTSTYMFPFAGIRPKYFAFLCGATALLMAIDDRPFLSGVAAAMGAGFWQMGGLLAFLVVGMALQRSGWRAAGRTVAGGVTVATLTVLPFVLTGNAIPLFVEVVLAPIYGVIRYTIPGRLLRTVIELGPGVALIPLGVYGWGRAAVADYDEYWWVAVGGGLYLLQVFLEFQGAIEMILVLMFLALGVGVLVAETSTPSRQSLVAVCILLLVATSFHWNEAATTPFKDAVEEEYEDWDVANYESLPEDPDGWPSMQTIYWEKRQPEYCHYRLGHKQKYFEQETGGTLVKETCGQWPYDEPAGEWFLGGLSPV
ncbi:DolP-mannose mannosyltransferase [Halorientalis brevis]|uniref:DolP-mannose mannosyltransferase n=1 Tax=Halorientalis brevis TaxID=1126241 RepID=A0ABD6CF62_9EURY|nr:DolP-mannose mannosyltransferase [Halorientalis brevis]